MDASSGSAALGASITSPAKIAFVAYAILAYSGKIHTSLCQFIIVAFFFFVLQVAHDDYLRIVLNRCAELRSDKARRNEGFV